MSELEAPLTLSNGTLVVGQDDPHNCYFQSGWSRPYSHATVAVIVQNGSGEIAMVARKQGEPAEGGKLALPGGYVELGQRLIDAAATEALEETGYSVVLLARFALMDGPMNLPGRSNEQDLNVVTVFTATAGEKVQDHDDEVTDVVWVSKNSLPPREQVAFGHYDIIGMWLRHQERPFDSLPIVPSELSAKELFPSNW